jgi:hypothetical protein
MELRQKFAAVEIQSDHRITEIDRDYCEQHQKAYETAISSFQELAFFWEDMNKVQQELLGGSNGPIFCDYLSSDDGPFISQDMIDRHINSLHTNFIENLTFYFNSSYRVSVDSSEISQMLIPQEPDGSWGSSRKDRRKKYREQMQALTIRYQDVVDQIILQLDGRSFSEQAFYELYNKCHDAAWNVNTQKPQFECRKDTITFNGCFCHVISYPFNGWAVQETMRDILWGLAHFETNSYCTLPAGFSALLGPGSQPLKEPVVEFPTCEKVKQMKLFKNNRVDLKFHSPQFAEQFVNKYLGAVS